MEYNRIHCVANAPDQVQDKTGLAAEYARIHIHINGKEYREILDT